MLLLVSSVISLWTIGILSELIILSFHRLYRWIFSYRYWKERNNHLVLDFGYFTVLDRFKHTSSYLEKKNDYNSVQFNGIHMPN